jgi:hypothetical protein
MHPETVQERLSVLRLLNEPLRRILQPVEPSLQKLLSLDRLLQPYGAADVDRSSSNALDALIMADLRTAPAALLERYMGKARVAKFRACHVAKG